MAEIAILGYGTVGSGVVEVLRTNQNSIDRKASQPIRVKYILDIRAFPGSPVEHLITRDINDILNDNDIKVVVEAMGGVEPAYTYVKKALLRGKSVCTSNKELVAKHGAELLDLARERNLNFLFEASVGGGIPIIRPLNLSLTADEIYEITGILNGTTNYILTKMSEENLDFDTCLKSAQELGYAERDPTADIEGWDSCRKIAILVSLAIGKQVDFENIHTEGITKITAADIEYAKHLNAAIKLLASAKIKEKGVYAWVSPSIVPAKHPLAMVNDVFNAIYVKGNVIGEVMFYGPGAGKLPTASAVVADVVDAVKHLNRNIMHFWSNEKNQILELNSLISNKLVRVGIQCKIKTREAIHSIFGNVRILDIFSDELGFIANNLSEAVVDALLKELRPHVNDIRSILRIEGELG